MYPVSYGFSENLSCENTISETCIRPNQIHLNHHYTFYKEFFCLAVHVIIYDKAKQLCSCQVLTSVGDGINA